jgi:hypothetical protein
MCAGSLIYINKLHPWCWVILTAHGSALIPNIIVKRRFPPTS